MDSGANGVQPKYEQGVKMQTHLDSRAALLVAPISEGVSYQQEGHC